MHAFNIHLSIKDIDNLIGRSQHVEEKNIFTHRLQEIKLVAEIIYFQIIAFQICVSITSRILLKIKCC